jgi:putative ABC transport system permease protein
MTALRHSWLALTRDWRSGELRLVALALLIAMTSITAVAMFTDRAFSAIETQAGALLAADLVLETTKPLAPALEQHARDLGLRTAHTLSFRSMVTVGDKLQLAEVKAVDSSYPLRGHLEIADRAFEAGRVAERAPQSGEVWADTQLLQILKLTPGQNLTLGEAGLPLSQVLLLEPDRGGDLFSIAPRVLMSLDDVPATRLVLPGSRVQYRLLLAGERAQVREYQRWVERQIDSTVRVITVREARVELRDAIERAQQFLGLAALTSVMLSGIAIANAARRFAARHLDTCAIMRCLGAKQADITRTFVLEMLWLFLLVGITAAGLAYFAQIMLANMLAGLVTGELPPPTLLPVLSGGLTGLVTLLGFALPPLLALRNVPPVRVLRRHHTPTTRRGVGVYIAALGTIAALAPWQVGQPRMTLYVLLGSCATVLILAGAAWCLVRALRNLRTRVGIAWRYGFANIARRAGSSIAQVVALGLGIMVMLVLSLVRGDLLEGWLQHLPPNANNQFLVNIQPVEVDAVRNYFAEHGYRDLPFYPMVRGRLVAINDQPVRPTDYTDPRAKRLSQRDFNLSWTQNVPPENRVVRGAWWHETQPEAKQFSIETGIVESLGLHIGDKLTYQIAERRVDARISNLREVNWDTFNVNFFVIAPPGLLDEFPATYITSLYVAPERKDLLSDLVRQHPSITVIDVAAIMDHVRGIMDRVAHAAEFVFLFTLAAGFLVLTAALQSTHDERLHESALLRSLGASSKTVAQGLAAEFILLGVVAGLLAAGAAIGLSYILSIYVFKIKFVFNPWLLPLGLLLGGLGVGGVGLVGTRKVLTHAPVEVLRHG